MRFVIVKDKAILNKLRYPFCLYCIFYNNYVSFSLVVMLVECSKRGKMDIAPLLWSEKQGIVSWSEIRINLFDWQSVQVKGISRAQRPIWRRTVKSNQEIFIMKWAIIIELCLFEMVQWYRIGCLPSILQKYDSFQRGRQAIQLERTLPE